MTRPPRDHLAIAVRVLASVVIVLAVLVHVYAWKVLGS
jgi:hypothetical protein